MNFRKLASNATIPNQIIPVSCNLCQFGEILHRAKQSKQKIHSDICSKLETYH